MNIEEIEVEIGRDGRVILHVRGVKGNRCLDLTRALEQVLGGQVVSREMTSEALEISDTDITRGQTLNIKATDE